MSGSVEGSQMHQLQVPNLCCRKTILGEAGASKILGGVMESIWRGSKFAAKWPRVYPCQENGVK